MLSAGHCADDEIGFLAGKNFIGEQGVGGFVGQVRLAGEEADEGAALECAVIPDRPAEHGISRFDGVENGAMSDWSRNLECEFAINMGERAEMEWEADADRARSCFTRLRYC